MVCAWRWGESSRNRSALGLSLGPWADHQLPEIGSPNNELCAHQAQRNAMSAEHWSAGRARGKMASKSCQACFQEGVGLSLANHDKESC